jgi:DNA ligase (NAD+)
MNAKVAKNRIDVLRKEIEKHSHLYYTLDAPKISDEAYDTLTRELLELEENYPDYKISTSPTQKVGGKILERFSKTKHLVLQWSYDNVFGFVD